MNSQKKLSSKHTNKELAEANIYPQYPDNAATEADSAFWDLRRNQFLKQDAEQKLFSNLLQLKFRIEDHLKNEAYDTGANFGYFLRNYIECIGKKHKEFAEEIDVTPAELSQLINNHRSPNNEILVRLEIHSNNNIPALTWYKIVEKNKEYYLSSNREIRKSESKHVKHKLAVTL